MSVALAPSPFFTWFTTQGLPAVGYQLYSYVAGTSTPQATYTDITQTVQNPNPVVLNSAGYASVWLVTGQTYKLVLKDASGNPVSTQDQISGGLSQAGLGAIFYPQTPAEIAASVTPVSYFYPAGNVLRYGTNTIPGNTDMTSAIQSAFTQAEQLSGAAVYIPGGTYLISAAVAYTFSGTFQSLSVRGDGSDVTVIKQSVAGDNGFVFNYIASTNSVRVRDMTLLTVGVNTGNGVTLNQTGSLGDNALSDVTGVTFRGADGYGVTECWATGVLSTGVSNVNFDGVAVWGGATQTGDGVALIGTSSVPTLVYNFSKCTFNTLDVGIDYGNYTQGVTVSQCNFTGDTIGIFAAGSLSGLEQLSVSQCQFECYTSDISIGSLIENTTISDNLFLIGVANNGSGVDLAVSGLFSITGNTFTFQSAGTTGKDGIIVNGNVNNLPGVITGNVFQGLNIGIVLLSGSAYVNVQSNAYSGNGTNTSNAGTSNTIGGGSA